MKVSLNWLKEYIKTDLSPEKIGEILTDIGLEVEGMEMQESIPGGLRGLVIGEVKECEKHPNADKLSLTKVDVGQENLLSIVCGAPNVAKGQKVVVATVGAMLYPSEGDPFKIKKGKIRGEVSEGMICAEDEIGLGKSHAGIMVLEDTVKVGTPAHQHFDVTIDYIYDIGLTPNRSDATGHLGVAFDLAAALNINFENQGTFQRPVVEDLPPSTDNLPIEVVVENETACPRYSGICVEGVTVQESPKWLKERLTALGLTPINNIVDITNFILHELGQPLHAFDYNEITGKKIIVKNLAAGTKFVTLDETERTLKASDLMICDGNGDGMCIAGVFGGIKSGVKDTTTNIFLEVAHFEAVGIRKTSMGHLLRTDAATRFEKGTDPNGTLYALKRATKLILDLAGGQIASPIIDHYPTPVERKKIDVSYHHINRLIGATLDKTEVKNILQTLDIHILEENDTNLLVSIPTDKADVTREVDVIEEILRIYGYNKIDAPTTLRSVLSFAPKPNPQKVKNLVAELLTSIGFNEMMATSLTKSAYFKEVLPVDETTLVYINNTSNQHLDVMRPSMVFSGLEAILHNQNRQHPNLRLYEFGKTYHKNGDAHEEHQRLTLFLTGQHTPESWHGSSKKEVNFYTLKAFVEQVLKRLGIAPSKLQHKEVEDNTWAYAAQYHRGKQNVVRFGRLQGNLTHKMDIKQEVFYAEFDWDSILQILKKHQIKSTSLAKFPAVRRDLALVVENTIKFEEILKIALKQGKSLLKDTNLFDVYENEEHLGKGKKSYAISFIFQDENKTLKDKDIDKIMNKLMATYERQLGALIRK